MYGPVCTVVWEGRSREAPPYPDFALFASLFSCILGGALANRINGLKTLLIGSSIRCAMLAVISQAREIWSLCALNLAFGLGYGDIIVMYAYIVWEYSSSGATR